METPMNRINAKDKVVRNDYILKRFKSFHPDMIESHLVKRMKCFPLKLCFA